jgi:FtsP/CotA-like multicopper oxidase with cupredoxin domain
MKHLYRALGPLALVALLVVAGFVGKAWYDSRLPDTFSAMEMGVPDYGGGTTGVHQHHGGRSVATLTGPKQGVPDYRLTLTAAEGNIHFRGGQRVDGLTFNLRVPGPEIRVHQGDLVEVTLVNKDVDDGVTIHWHGVDVPNAEDGVAGVTQNEVPPGGRYRYRFRVKQVGTFWYHSHQVSSTEVRRGLYGAFVILPRKSEPAVHDETVVIHDFGGTAVVNDVAGLDQRAIPPGTKVRLRLVNSNSSSEKVELTGTPFRVTAIDGADLNGPQEIEGRTLEIGGGARYDVEFTMPPTGARLDVLGTDTGLLLGPDGKTGLPNPEGSQELFDPATYGSPKATPFAGAAFDRTFDLRITKKIGFLDGRPGRHWAVNGKVFPETPMFMVRTGDLVRVRIDNETSSIHPMHLHGHHALVLSRDGKPTTGSPWWVDTLNVLPDERYEVAFRADNPGIWMDHCHNLQHAADGFVLHLAYEGVTTPFRVGGQAHNHPE